MTSLTLHDCCVVGLLFFTVGCYGDGPCSCPCSSTGRRCVRDCTGLPDGDYQSCGCCHGKEAYITCVAGRVYRRPCPANLVWADDAKICNYTSRTCHECAQPHPDPGPCDCPCRSTGRSCVRSCSGMKDGDYQSCQCCHGKSAYVTCSNGLLYNRPCPADLVWADDAKICNYTSQTCRECAASESENSVLPYEDLQNPPRDEESHVTSDNRNNCPCWKTGRACIESCQGLPDGDYQSCRCCHGYVSCTAGTMSIYRICPANLVWADNTKRCNYTSVTCKECIRQKEESSTSPVQMAVDEKKVEVGKCPCKSTGKVCITDCSGRPDGFYQSCNCCQGAAACSNGRLSYIPCPVNLVWDDTKKYCDFDSSTCTECVKQSDRADETGAIEAKFAPSILDQKTTPRDEESHVTSDNRNNCPCWKTGRACIESCQGLPDGDYQSCRCCHGYVSCTAGTMSIYRICPANLVWADNTKRCNYTSVTCKECARQPDDSNNNGIILDATSAIDQQKKSNHEEELDREDIDDRLEDQQETDDKCPCPTCPCRSTGRRCTRTCRGLPDGDYQSCGCCHGYVSCSNEQLIPRPCPKGPNGTLVWADNIKRCNYTSYTCRECVRSKDSVPMLELQPAKSASTLESVVVDRAQCDCMNCPCKNTGPSCITSCLQVPIDGDYQSCGCCRAYVTCVGDVMFSNRSCPAGLVWADDVKECNFTSNTCRECVTIKDDAAAAAAVIDVQPINVDNNNNNDDNYKPCYCGTCPCNNTGSRCISDCSGRADGDYQSCSCCGGYVSCVSGRLVGNRPCAASLLWDDELKVCAHSSATCRECVNKQPQMEPRNWYKLQSSRDRL